jgi:hypothetical protein
MNKVYFVYCLTFSNNKVYIGMSATCAKGLYTNRFRQHRNAAAKGKDLLIYSAWRKHGEPVQTILSLHEDRESCAIAEIQAIIDYKAIDRDFGYNIANGGQGLNFYNNPALYELMKIKVWQNPERTSKLKEANKGKKPSQATMDAYKQWRKTDSAKEVYARPWTQERIIKASESTRLQMANGGAENLSKAKKGLPDHLSIEARNSQKQKIKVLMNTEYGKDIARRGYAAMVSNPENVKKYREGTAKWRESDANKENCRRIAKLSAEKCSKKVKLIDNDEIFNSQKELARKLNVSDALISLWVKSGKVVRV